MSHPYPHFLIAGFMKCATTTLFEHLLAHPLVQAPVKKELHYFTRELDPLYDPALFGMEYFEQLRFDPTSGKLCGEASPSYILAARRIAVFNPAAKIIFLVRDPVERALSQFRQYRKYKLTADAQALDQPSIAVMNVVKDSCYARHISTFVEQFPIHNILIVSYEEFCASPQITVDQVLNFLDLDSVAIDESVRLSTTESELEPEGLREAIDLYFRDRRGELAELIARYNMRIAPNTPDSFNRY